MKGFTPFHAKWFRNVINSLVQELCQLWLGRVYLGRGGRNCSLGVGSWGGGLYDQLCVYITVKGNLLVVK